MRGLQKSKRVSWASDINLCQVRLFLSEECPSQVGLGGQDHLQAKTSWLAQSTNMNSDENLPPGFEGTPATNLFKHRLSQIPIVKWRCPPRFVLDLIWQVVSGEESKEVETQNQREMRVLEAVYPRPSAIPSNPSLLKVMEEHVHNDQSTPLIPITPVEDEEVGGDSSLDLMAPDTFLINSQPQPSAPRTPASSQSRELTEPNTSTNGIPVTGMVHGVQPDAVAAAYASLTSVMTNSDQEKLIDRNLLIKILSDPKLVENLISSQGTSSNSQLIPKPRSPGGVTLSDSPLVHANKVTLSDSPPVHANKTEAAATSNGPFYPTLNRMGPAPSLRLTHIPDVSSAPPPPPMGVHAAKDMNYYKSLIQLHGEETQDALPQFSSRHSHPLGSGQEGVNNLKPRDSKPKIMKPCIYFNSSRGCRHGANCAYQHDTLPQQRVSSMPEVQTAKRMKMDREITGT